MNRNVWIVTLFLMLIVGRGVSADEPPCQCPDSGFLQRLRPAGGWCPYGGLLHWWNPCCFPRCGAPDDYCRKTLPDVCRPVYPAWYTFGPRQDHTPQGQCSQPANAPR